MSSGIFVLAGTAALFPSSALSQTTETWNGSSSTAWATPANWTPATVPGATSGTTNTDTALFNGTVTNQPVLGAAYNLQNISFGSTTGLAAGATSAMAYTISGTGLVLTTGGSISNFNTQTAGLINETVGAPITLTPGSYTFNGSGTGLSGTVNNFLVFGGNITGAAGAASALTLTGTNYVPFSNLNVNAPGVGVTIANQINSVIANGAGGTVSLAISGSAWALLGNNSYTGGTTINGGSVYINSSTSLGASTAANAIAFTGLGGTIYQANGTGVTLGQNISIANGASATISTGNTTTLTGLVSGAGSLIRMGAGTTNLSNTANTFSGGIAFNGTGTSIGSNNSVVQFSADSALGTGAIVFNGTGQLTANSTVTLNTNHGPLIVAAGSTAGFSANGAGVTFTVPNAIVGSGGVTTTGAGVTILSGANNFLGQTSINGGTLRAGAVNVLGLGTLAAQTAGTTLDLNGFSQYTGQLNGANTNIAGSTILNNGASAATLTINQTGNSTFGGLLNDGSSSLAFTKIGSGQQTLVRQNGYTGNTAVNQGTLLLNFAPTAAQVITPTFTTNIINSASALALGGGTVSANGLVGTTNIQTFNGTTLNAGHSSVTSIAGSAAGVTTGGTTGTMTVNLGAITRNIGSTVNFTLTSGTAGNAAITTTSGSGGGSLLTDANGTAYATVGGVDWAATTGASGPYNIAAGSSVGGFYTTVAGGGSFAAATNADITGASPAISVASSVALSSLRYNSSTAGGTITIGSGQTLATGGILLSSNIGSGNNPTITGGTLTGTAGGDLTILMYGGGTLGVNSIIANNGLAAMGLTRGGTAGNVALNGVNTYTGVTTINGGTLVVNSLYNGGIASSIGASGSGAGNLVLNGGALQLNALPGVGLIGTTDRLFSLGVNGGTLSSGQSGAPGLGSVMNFTNTGIIGSNGQIGARTLTLSGTSTQVNILASELDDYGGPSSLTKAGSGAASTAIWKLTGTNRYTGTTTISGGAGSLQAGTSFVQGSGAAGTNSGGAMIGTSALGNGTAALTFTPTATFNATLDLIGTNQMVGAFSGTTNTGFVGVVQNSSATAASLTVGNGSNANTVFTGTIIDGSGGGAVSFAKNGLNTAGLTSVQIIPTVSGATTTGATGYTPNTYFGAATTISSGGTLALQGVNSYTGTTTVNGGTLMLDSAGSTTARLSGTSSITINNGGTLLLANSAATTTSGVNGTVTSINRINDAANVIINGGGRFATGGVSEGSSAALSTAGLGTLTLTSTLSTAPSIIDFGAGSNGSTLLFTLMDPTNAGNYANILNWTGSAGIDSGAAGNDRLLFMSTTGFNAAQLANIQFYGDSGQLLGSAMEISYNGFYELVPTFVAVPEPSTYMLLGSGLAALVFLRRRRKS